MNTREQETEEFKKEHLRIEQGKQELMHELRAPREIQRGDEESSCERHNKGKPDGRVNLEPPPPRTQSCSSSSKSESSAWTATT